MQRHPKKKPMLSHNDSELQQIERTRWQPPNEHTYVDLQYRREFAPPLKRSFGEFRASQQAQQNTPAATLAPPRRVYPTGETRTPPSTKLPGDPDDLMTDAPPMPHVKWTPPVDYKPNNDFQGFRPHKSILKRRMNPYGQLEPGYEPDIPTVQDLSPYIEWREGYDAVIDAKRTASNRRSVGSVALPYSPRPKAQSLLRERPSLDGRQFLAKLKQQQLQQKASTSRSTSQQYRVSKPSSSFQPRASTRPSAISRSAVEILQQEFAPEHASASTTSRPPLRQPRLAQQHLFAPLDTTEVHPRILVTAPEERILEPRKILSPVSQHKRSSPPRSATEIYPSLRASYQQEAPANQLPADETLTDESAIRRIALRFAGGVSHLAQHIYNAILGNLFGIWPEPEEEVFAVETNSSGRKRRRIAAADMVEQTQPNDPETAPPPGTFPSDDESDGEQKHQRDSSTSLSPSLPNSGRAAMTASQQPSARVHQASENLDTPPESGPENSDNEEEAIRHDTSEDHEEEQPRRVWNTVRNPTLHAKTDEEILRARMSTLRLPDDYVQKGLKVYDASNSLPSRARPLTRQFRPIFNKSSRNISDRDSDIDALIQNAKTVSLRNREDARLRESLRVRKERLSATEDELRQSRDFKKEAQLQTQEEHERFRKQAEEEAAKLVEEQEARRKQEQEEAAQRAAEEARKADVKNLLVRPLDPEWEKRVSDAMAHTNPKHPIAETPDGITLTRYDMGKILPQTDSYGKSMEGGMTNDKGKAGPTGWLNDEAVNAMIAMIVARRKEQTGYVKGPNNVPEIEGFNSGWYTNYKNAKGVTGIRTWSRRKGIQGEKLLRAKHIFFPINTGAHWLLLIISPMDRKIELLDSASNNSLVTKTRANSKFFQIAHEWLSMELGSKYKAEEWTDSTVSSQQQTNFDDCGVFTCMNALACSKGKPFSEVPANAMKDARKMIVAVLMNGGFHGDWEL